MKTPPEFNPATGPSGQCSTTYSVVGREWTLEAKIIAALVRRYGDVVLSQADLSPAADEGIVFTPLSDGAIRITGGKAP